MASFSWFIGYSVGKEGKSTSLNTYPSLVGNKITATAQTLQTTNYNATATAISGSTDTHEKTAYNSGFQAGYSRGKQDGYTSGYSDGLTASTGKTNNSYQQGYSDGQAAAQSQITSSYNQGKQDGYNSGYNDGYNKGYTDGENAEYASIISWLETKCTKDSNGYYPYVYISNGTLYCN
jgi:flagellar biosynthesis/type III secretory pathway protein FliH